MKIVVMGDMLLDVTVRYDPNSGEADSGPEGVQIWPGGSAANFAVHAARLGAEVRYIGRVGRDHSGELLVRALREEGITTSVREVKGETTGRVLVMVDPEGHRRMWSYPGASSLLDPDDLETEWFRDADAFHITGYSLLREGPREAALKALRLARENNASFCTLDPNPPHLIENYGPQRFRDTIAQLRFDAIFPNSEEGTLMSGKETPEEIALNLLDVSPMVVLTLGADGCIAATRNEQVRLGASPAERVIDVTGAGDAFAAGFVVAYLSRNHSLGAAALAGNRLAAEVVGRPGGR